jgi:hypothetical protein
MALFEIDPQILPNLKLGLHSFQIVLGFLVFCLEIAVFRGETSRIVGLNGWTFAVVSVCAAQRARQLLEREHESGANVLSLSLSASSPSRAGSTSS